MAESGSGQPHHPCSGLFLLVEHDWTCLQPIVTHMFAAAGLDRAMLFIHRRDLITIDLHVWRYIIHVAFSVARED